MHFFDQLRAEHPRDERLTEHLGFNYDTCHFAVEFEEPQNALACLVNHGIKISKIHLSSALKVCPTPAAREALKRFDDEIYLHQVVTRDESGRRMIFRDLPEALVAAHRLLDTAPRRPDGDPGDAGDPLSECPELPEWRIHFHVPLHAPAEPPFENTNDHLLGILDLLAECPGICSHLEMETYTWEVLPPELKSQSVVDQLAAEYEWTLARLQERGLA
jgi:hypothetical protein